MSKEYPEFEAWWATLDLPPTGAGHRDDFRVIMVPGHGMDIIGHRAAKAVYAQFFKKEKIDEFKPSTDETHPTESG